MDDAASEHPDEGTIHAWLDGALDDATAQALAAHVSSCRPCAERVAEARGLIAGASRIVRALDTASSSTSAAWGQAPAAAAARPSVRSAWNRLRVTPARAAIAATLLVALGVSLTYRRTAVETEASRALSDAPAMAPTVAPNAAPVRDSILESAVARNLAKVQPPRALEAAPGPTVVPEPPPAGVRGMADAAAPTRVGAARAEMARERTTTAGVAPDQLSARVPGVALDVDRKAVAAASRADSVVAASTGSVVARGAAPDLARPAAPSVVQPVAAPAECIRVESANAVTASWGSVALPLIVRLDSTGRMSPVLTVAGQPTNASVAIIRAGDDSLLLRLRRIGFEGTLALAGRGDTRPGVMRSRPAQLQLESTVVTSTAEAPEPAAQRRSAARKAAPSPRPSVDSAEARAAATAAPAVAVVGRKVACP